MALNLAGLGQQVLSRYRPDELSLHPPCIVSPIPMCLKHVLWRIASHPLLNKGMETHAHILRHGFDSHLHIMTTLVDVYSKFGYVTYASRVFHGMPVRNVVSWSAMIAYFSKNGRPFQLFRGIMMVGNQDSCPNSVTMLSVLQACSALAALERGRMLHAYILRRGLDTILPVSSALIVMYARCGQLEMGHRVFNQMDKRDVVSWNSLISSYGLEPTNAGNYVLLADIYAQAGLGDEVKRVKKLLEARGLQKVPGRSCIEVKRKIYSFVSVDEFNPQVEQLHALVDELSTEMKDKRFLPQTKDVLYDLDAKEKEQIVLGHSEKVAVAFGLIN
ncbi:hypothetical protein Tsubulata_000952, partial [Turnera subulata]